MRIRYFSTLAASLLLCLAAEVSAAPVIEHNLTYVERSSGPLQADVHIPDATIFGTGPFPAVIVIHGGGWVRGERADMRKFADRLVEAGLVAINISYRLAPDHPFPAAIHDCKTAVRWARKNANRFHIDPDRIGAWGFSAGAHLALMLGVTSPRDGLEGSDSRIPSRVQAVVSGAGPTDLRGFDDSRLVRQFLGGKSAGREAIYAAASPITHVSADDAPTFLYHGRRDRIVRYPQSESMHAALQRARVPVELFPTTFGHTLTFLADDKAFAAGLEFLKKWLMQSTTKP